MKKLLLKFLNVLLPPRCLKCGRILTQQNGLCPECFQKINFIGEPMCRICGFPFGSENIGNKNICAACAKQDKHLIDCQRTVFVYDDFSKSIIIDLKFHDKTSYAQALARMLYAAGKDIWIQKPDFLLPVPIHRNRLLKRRYNQSALLVKALSKLTGIKADYFHLLRVRNTVPQVQLSANARRNNLIHAFAVKDASIFKGKKVVLVDDVATTGSTLNECAKVLKKAGAAEVYAVILGRTKE